MTYEEALRILEHSPNADYEEMKMAMAVVSDQMPVQYFKNIQKQTASETKGRNNNVSYL